MVITSVLWIAAASAGQEVDLAPRLPKGSTFEVVQEIGKRLPDPTGDGLLESVQTVTWELAIDQGGRVGTDTIAVDATLSRVTSVETASGQPRTSFDSSAGPATTDEEKIQALGVTHTWRTWLAGDGGTHVKQDRAPVETRAKAIGLPAQLLDLLLQGWTDEALGATVRDMMWDGPRDVRAPGATWTDTHPGGAGLVGVQGDVERSWTFASVDGDIATLTATMALPDSHVTQDGRCTLTLRTRLGGAPVERRTECTVTNASLDVQQEVWLSYRWSER